MTVRVVGRWLETRQVVCEGCKRTLEYSFDDVHRFDSADRTPGPCWMNYVTCPKCNMSTDISLWMKRSGHEPINGDI